MSLGPSEIILIVVVIVLIFGAKKIPEIARALGRAGGEYKKAKKEFMDEVENASGEQTDKKDSPSADSSAANQADGGKKSE